MDEAGFGVLLVHGTGALGQYGNLAYVAGSHLPTKSTYAVLRRGLPPVLVTSSAGERRAIAGAVGPDLDVVAPQKGGRAEQVAQVAQLCVGNGPVAVAGPPDVPYQDSVTLQAQLGGPLPVVQLVSEARRALTDHDRALMRAEATRIEAAYQSLPGLMRPKDTERDVAALVEAQLVRRGSVVRVVQVSAGRFHGQQPSATVLHPGDLITVFVESASATGHWVELGLIAHVGSASPVQRQRAQVLQSALRRCRHALLPGRGVATIVEELAPLMRECGTATIGLGHGTGVDEQSWHLTPDERRSLLDGEAIAVHPSLELANGTAAAVANTFFVSPTTAEPLSQMPFTTLTLPHL